MAGHQITVFDVEWGVRGIHQTVVSSSGRGDNKRLVFFYDIAKDHKRWSVFSWGVEKRFATLEEAVEAYNAAEVRAGDVQ